MAGTVDKAAARPNALLILAIEFAPLVAFFNANRALGILPATAVFVAATIAAAATTVVLARRLPPILLFNAAMVLVFGGLTLLLRDALFIKIKPTVDYAFFAGLLLFGHATGRLFLRDALGSTFPGLGEAGWRLLTRRWALFFVAMAVANEIAWRALGTDSWVTFRVWVPPVATLAFGAAHLPVLLRMDAAAQAGETANDHG